MSNVESLIQIVCPKCKTDNGVLKIKPALVMTIFIEVACSNCRSRVVTASDTTISGGPNKHALELKQAQDDMRAIRGENERLARELADALTRIEQLVQPTKDRPDWNG